MKTTSFQELFDELPLSLVENDAPSAHAVSEDVYERVWQRVKTACDTEQQNSTPTVRTWRKAWIIPVAAILFVAATLSCLALTTHWFEPQFWFSHSVDRDGLVAEYDGMVSVGTNTISGNLSVTLDGFVLDADKDTLTMSISVASTDGMPLVELTAERISWISQMSFRKITLYRNGTPIVLERNKVGDGFASGGVGMVRRTDDVSDPSKATFQITYDALGPDKDLTGDSFVLELQDLTDIVKVREDIGLQFASLSEVQDTLGEANDDRLVFSKETDDGKRYQLMPGETSVPFCTRLKHVHIDGIMPYYDSERDEEYLYISYCADALDEDTVRILDDLTLVDMRKDRAVGGTITHQTETRVTLCYHGVTQDDLPHLFMMKYKGYETVARAQGTWTMGFEAEETDSLVQHTRPIDETFTYGAYTLHATSLTISDHSLFIEGTVTADSTLEDTNILCDYHTAVTLSDGTQVSPILWQGGFNDDLSDGEFWFGGDMVRYIDHTQVTSVTLFGKTVELHRE